MSLMWILFYYSSFFQEFHVIYIKIFFTPSSSYKIFYFLNFTLTMQSNLFILMKKFFNQYKTFFLFSKKYIKIGLFQKSIKVFRISFNDQVLIIKYIYIYEKETQWGFLQLSLCIDSYKRRIYINSKLLKKISLIKCYYVH